MSRGALRSGLLVALGSLSLAVGVVGIVVPLLPTTIFLLIAAACYARSSARLHRWLLRHRLFGAYIENYQRHRAMTPAAKGAMLAVLWIAIGVSAVWVVSSLLLRLTLLAIATGVTIYILRLRTMPGPPRDSGETSSSPARPAG